MIQLVNKRLMIQVHSECGGRIDSLIDLQSGKEWVWHPIEYQPLTAINPPVGSVFDKNWKGGWNDIFPTSSPGFSLGRQFYDHGDFWNQPWQVIESTQRATTMRCASTSYPIIVEKICLLENDEPNLKIRYRFKNVSQEKLPFLFNLHLALAVDPQDPICMPPSWIQAMGPPSNVKTYSGGLQEGWCGAKNNKTGTQLLFHYKTVDFPYIWIPPKNEKLQDPTLLLLQPCTSLPQDIRTAEREGSWVILNSNELREFEIYVRIN